MNGVLFCALRSMLAHQPRCVLQNPYKAPGYRSERDRRTDEEKAKHACRKTSTERARLLQEIFEAVEVSQEEDLIPVQSISNGIHAKTNIQVLVCFLHTVHPNSQTQAYTLWCRIVYTNIYNYVLYAYTVVQQGTALDKVPLCSTYQFS